MKKFNPFWIITISIAIAIFGVSSIPFGESESSTPINPLKSIAYHFTVFFLLSFFTLAALQHKKTFIGMVACMLYAISDELHQFFVPGRCCSLMDIIIDVAGIFFAYFIFQEVKKWQGF